MEMNMREKVIQNYMDGYNQFDVEKMIADFDETIVFENVQNGITTMSLQGLAAFRQQAEQAKSYFSSRNQVIISISHREAISEVVIQYSATLAMDFPNGLKKGQELTLTGKSIFEFDNRKIIKLTDVS